MGCTASHPRSSHVLYSAKILKANNVHGFMQIRQCLDGYICTRGIHAKRRKAGRWPGNDGLGTRLAYLC